ncbi:MAG TPA: hypothetical protein VNR61_10985 [Niallia sp.]|nr:hypothetical protein [Niallia sp.]
MFKSELTKLIISDVPELIKFLILLFMIKAPTFAYIFLISAHIVGIVIQVVRHNKNKTKEP